MNFRRITLLTLVVLFALNINAQEADPHDFGKMWTFENPPIEWFKEKYNFEPDQAWFDHVRKSSVKFASWCSGSFVSPNGLIMTNHHCSSGVTMKVEREGEDFTSNGFYAPTMGDERKVEGLFVDQLIHAIDVTDLFNQYKMERKGISDKEVSEGIAKEYAGKEGWENLRIEMVDYYSGAKKSVFGYKRYNDIRLVLVPEIQIGFYGGEEDNFTYPRYNLDFTFWRAYDEAGKPLNTKDFHFKFNPNGPKEEEAVFVVGSPARTERYRTVAQLEYDRDYRYPMILTFLENRQQFMKKDFAENPSPALRNQIMSFGNSIKVYRGILKGLNNEELMSRKVLMEERIQKSHSGAEEWGLIDKNLGKMKDHAWALNLLGVSPFKGKSFMLLHSLAKYEHQLLNGTENNEIEISRDEIREVTKGIGSSRDKEEMVITLKEIENFIPKGNTTLAEQMQGRTVEEYTDFLFEKSKFYHKEKTEKLLGLKAKKFAKKNDPLLNLSRALIKAYEKASKVAVKINPENKEAQKTIAAYAFDEFGDNLPPDATFTLRISDGIVKGYDYNGTKAPFQTTFFGLYDRYHSHRDKPSWDLPARWKTAVPEMLATPMNFISTNDIIGGNSGSPIINKKMEVVGLIFDGNIESLPGNFIFDEEANRAVSVHAGGMMAAIQYVYKAKRLAAELLGKN